MKDDYLNIKVKGWKREINICIISIIEEEMQSIISKYSMEVVNDDNYMHWIGSVPNNPNIKIHCYQQNEPGNIYSAQVTNYVLEKKYDAYFCVGTAGSIQTNLYDVIIVNQIIYLGKGANTVDGRKFDGKATEISEKSKNIINSFLLDLKKKTELNFDVSIKPIYAGDDVEKNPEHADLLEARGFARHLSAIDMESFGVYQAINFYESFESKEKKLLFILRGISDRGDGLKNSIYEDGLNEKQRKEHAMNHVMIILNEFILFVEKIMKR